MSKPKLTYFDFAGSRGEECRLALHVAGVDFEDHRVKGPEFAELVPSLPFGSLPVLEIPNKGVLAQSNAILRFIGTQHNLHPKDPWEAARHDSIMDAVEEFRGKINPSLHVSDAEAKKAMRQKLASEDLPKWAARMERLLTGDGPFVAGSQISVVDFKVYMAIGWIAKGVLDHIPADLFNAYPKLMRLYHAVAQHPGVVGWYAKTSKS
jgi:glutathione S-transferase